MIEALRLSSPYKRTIAVGTFLGVALLVSCAEDDTSRYETSPPAPVQESAPFETLVTEGRPTRTDTDAYFNGNELLSQCDGSNRVYISQLEINEEETHMMVREDAPSCQGIRAEERAMLTFSESSSSVRTVYAMCEGDTRVYFFHYFDEIVTIPNSPNCAQEATPLG